MIVPTFYSSQQLPHMCISKVIFTHLKDYFLFLSIKMYATPGCVHILFVYIKI